MEAVKIGLIGCGVISGAYLKAAQIFPVLELVACADIDPDASARSASEFGIPAMSVDDLLGSSEIELVLNLTIPAAHAQVNAAALEAGKHVYCEKPFALNTGEGPGSAGPGKPERITDGMCTRYFSRRRPPDCTVSYRR